MIDNFIVYDFFGTIADVIHTLHPQHLIIRFELFGYAFLFGELFHKPIKHFIRIFVNICEIGGELTAR